MTATAVLVVVPTVGHVNTGVAVAEVLRQAGLAVRWITGTSVHAYVEALGLAHDVTCLASHDLVMDRRTPGRRPHLEQLADEDLLERSLRDELAVIEAVDARLLVTKDFFTPLLASAATGVPWVALHTDGPGPLADGLPVGTDRLAANLAAVAGRHRLAPGATLAAPHRSPTLNVVRGFPELSAREAVERARAAGPVAFGGDVVFDGPPGEVAAWERRLGELPRPLVFVSFGTVCYEPEPYRAVLEVARRSPATFVVTCLHLDLDRIGAVPGNVTWERYVPVAAAAATADVVVHHGGHGTLLSSLVRGVPSVVAPLNTRSSQQGAHARRVVELGVGSAVDPADLSPAALGAAVDRALDPACRQRAAALAARLRERSPVLRAELVERLRAAAGPRRPPPAPGAAEPAP